MDKNLAANSTLSHYRIISQIGVGGMGEVYLAEDTKLERKVALKVLPTELAANEDRMRRFTREAKAAAALNHPNIAHIYEVGEADGTNFIALEFVDGRTLGELLRDPANLPRTLRILQHVADALAKAHAAGIVHRDLKPDNIMVTRDWHAKILDFGLAKLVAPAGLGESHDSSNVATAILEHHSTPGTILGTAGYMSPEQAQGKVNEIDHRSDIFSFGCILFEAATGKRAFEGADAIDTLNKIIREPAPPVSSINPSAPVDLQRIIRRCLAKDPEERYQSIKDVAIELKELRHEMTGEIDTTIPPMSVGGTTAGWRTATDGQLVVPSAVSDAPPRVSSAEYLVSEIKRRKPAAAIASVILVGAIALAVWFVGFRSTPAAAINSIAVLPFENRSDDPNADYLSDGLAESLIYRLSQLPNLKVSPTSSVMRYKGKGGNLATIAGELGVQAVLTGRVVQRGDNLSISVELIDTANNKVLWGEQYEKKMSDLLATQREIATAITDKLQLKLSGSETAGITKKYTNDNEAYQLYLKGRFSWNKRTVEGLTKAVDFYNQAIARDPTFALAYSGLAESYVLYTNYSVASPKDSQPLAKAAALKAIELDATLAEPHAALGLYYSIYAWNDPAAEKEFRRAIELNPKYATAHHWIANAPLLSMKRFDESLAAGQRAIELDPLSVIISTDQGYNYFYARRYDDAIAQLQLSLLLEPNFYYAHYFLGMVYIEKGMHKEAIAALRRSLELNEDPYAKALLVRALARSGERAEALKVRDELRKEATGRYFPSYFLAVASVALGDLDEAFALLDKDLVERSSYITLIPLDPLFDPLRGDPRFKALVQKIEASKLE